MYVNKDIIIFYFEFFAFINPYELYLELVTINLRVLLW